MRMAFSAKSLGLVDAHHTARHSFHYVLMNSGLSVKLTPESVAYDNSLRSAWCSSR
jgi:hypothetical protein